MSSDLHDRLCDRAALATMAQQFLNGQRYEEAISPLTRLMSLDPNSAEVQSALGLAYLRIGRNQEAAKACREGLRLSVDRPLAALANLAAALTANGPTCEAVPVLIEVFDRGIRDAGTTALLIDSVLMSDRPERAIDFLIQAIALYPEISSFPYTLASELQASGRLEEALVAARRASELAPTSAAALTLLASLLKQTGQFQEAIAILRGVLRDNFSKSNVHVELYESLRGAYGNDDLVPALEKMLLDSPDDDALRYQLSRVLLERRELDAGLAVYSTMSAAAKAESVSQEILARLSLAKGDLKTPVAIYQKIWDEVAATAVVGRPSEIAKPSRPVGAINPVLYLPVEIKQRELASRVLIACFAAKHGLRSVIGPTRTLTVGSVPTRLPRGIFLQKTLYKIDWEKVLIAFPGGHRFAAIDEEAMGRAGTDKEILATVDPRILPLLERVFLCGPRHAVAYRNVFPKYAERTRTVGNPRLDLLAPAYQPGFDEESAAIRARHGKFVLVCTNFASINSTWWHFADACRSFMTVVRMEDEAAFREALERAKGAVSSECEYMIAFDKIIPQVAQRLPHLRFVVRGHPQESTALWNHLAAEHENIVIDNSGSLQAMMAASQAMVYLAGCATGIEASLAGRPAIKFEVNPDLKNPRFVLSFYLNEPSRNADEIVHQIREIEKLPAGVAVRRPQDDAILAENFALSEEPAAKRIADSLQEIYAKYGRGMEVEWDKIKNALEEILVPAAAEAVRLGRGRGLVARKQVMITQKEVESLMDISAKTFNVGADVAVLALSSDTVLVAPRPAAS